MAAQASNIKEIENYTQTISANVTNLLSEVARLSAVQTAPPPPPSPPPPPQTNTINNIHINDNSNFDEILRQLQNITSELTGLRQDVDAMKAQLGQDCSGGNDESRQRATDVTEPNLEELMELKEALIHRFHPETGEEYNEIARRYNSDLRCFQEDLAPLHNSNDKPVFGFPGTVGELFALSSDPPPHTYICWTDVRTLFIDPTAEKLLCGAFGIEYLEDANVFATFCGVDCASLRTHFGNYITGNQIAYLRVVNRNKRARDVAAAGDPTPETRRAAVLHNKIAHERNAAADSNVIMPLHDERNLAVPGFPEDRRRFTTMQKADLLWLMGEFRVHIVNGIALLQFADFIGLLKRNPDGDKVFYSVVDRIEGEDGVRLGLGM